MSRFILTSIVLIAVATASTYLDARELPANAPAIQIQADEEPPAVEETPGASAPASPETTAPATVAPDDAPETPAESPAEPAEDGHK